jgi:hypothetical protein
MRTAETVRKKTHSFNCRQTIISVSRKKNAKIEVWIFIKTIKSILLMRENIKDNYLALLL